MNAMPSPVVEEVLHQSGIEIQKATINAEGDQIVLLRFHTPHKVYTVKMSVDDADQLVKALVSAVGPPKLVLASPSDIPNLRAVG